MSIPKETVQHVAKLARLDLSEAEIERYTEELSKILGLVDQLNQLDLSQVEVAMSLEHPTVFREDVAVRRFTREQLIANAPLEEEGFFRVPKILEESTQ